MTEDINQDSNADSLIPSIPVSIPNGGVQFNDNLATNAITKDTTSVFGDPSPMPSIQPVIMGGTPIEQGRFIDKEAPPTFMEQVGHAFYKNNLFTQTGEYVSTLFDKMANAQDDTPFDPFDYNEYKDYPSQYWPDILNAVSNKDRKRIQDRINEQMETDKRYANSSMLAEIIGGGAGVALGSVGALLPIIGEAEFAGVAQNVLRNVQNAAPMLAADSISRQALISANEYGQNIKSQAINTGVDFAFNILLYGAGKALMPAKRNMQLWESRKTVATAIDEKVNIDFVVNEKGEYAGVSVSPAPGVNLSAAKVDAVKLLVDEQMNMSGVFSLPGGKKLAKAIGFASPVVKAATSPYITVKSFFNRIASHGVITQGEAKGMASADQAYTYAAWYTDKGIELGNIYRQKFYEANGITSSNNYFSALKNLKQTFSNQATVTSEQFSKEYYKAMAIGGYKSPYSQVHEIADIVHKELHDMNVAYNKSVGRDELFKDPRNAFRYTPLAHDVAKMTAKPQLWQQKTASYYKEAHGKIQGLKQPIESTKERIANLSERIKTTDKSDRVIRNYKNQLAAAEKLLERQQDELVEKILNDESLHILLNDRVPFTSAELKQLKALHEPIKRVESKIAELEDELATVKTKKGPKLKKEAKQERINEIEKSISKLENQLDDLNAQLFDDAYNGKIPKHFWYEADQMVKLHDAEFKPDFVNYPDTDEGRLLLAKSVFDSITSQSQEDLMYAVTKRHKDGAGSPDYLKARSHLVPMELYIEDGFLEPNVDNVLSNYYKSMGKVIGWNRAFEGQGIEFYIDALKNEHEDRVAKIQSTETGVKQEKALQKAYKELNDATQFMNDTYKVYFGTYNTGKNQKVVQASHAIKNLVASAKLGSVPIYQLTELSYVALKSSLFPLFGKTLKPLITSMYGLRNTPEWEIIKKNAANFGLAQNHLTQNIGAWLEGGAQGQIRTGSFVSNAAGWSEQLAHVAGDMYGINFLSNVNEMLAANAYTSSIMQAAYDHAAGKITALQRQQMAHIGINMDSWSKRLIDQFERHGGVKESGGYQVPTWEWSDLEAQERMRLSVRRAVSDTVVNRDPFSKPYFLANDPIASMVFMFHGWAYGALSRYTIPALQRADAKTAMGLAVVVGSSLLSEPLLRLANGKEMFDEDEKWWQAAFKAIDYSGALGPSLTYLQDLNKMMGNMLLPKLQTERTKAQPGFSAALGPVFGYADNGLRIAAHAFKGDLTKGDYQSMARMMPLLSGLPQRYAINNILSQLDLPEDRRGAEPWAWYNYMYGEE